MSGKLISYALHLQLTGLGKLYELFPFTLCLSDDAGPLCSHVTVNFVRGACVCHPSPRLQSKTPITAHLRLFRNSRVQLRSKVECNRLIANNNKPSALDSRVCNG